MAKAKKSKAKSRTPAKHTGDLLPHPAPVATGTNEIGPPQKKPFLLQASVVLFVVWFLYLLVVALGG